MSMHSRIGLLNYDGTITSIYCEIEYSRNILKYCYSTRSKVIELLNKGDLRPIVYEGGGCVVPKTSPARTDDNLSDYIKNGEYYNYLFDGEVWTVHFHIGNPIVDYGHYCRFGLMSSDRTIQSIKYWVYNTPEDILALLNKEYNTRDEVSTLMQENGIGEVRIILDDKNVEVITFWPDPYFYVQPRIEDIPPYNGYPYIPNGEYCNFLFKNNSWTYHLQDYTII